MPTSRPRRAARALLLLAALLHLLGSVAGPWAHLHGRGWAGSAAISADPHSWHLPLVHSEAACSLCQGVLAAPPSSPALPLAHRGRGTPALRAARAPALARLTTPGQPRAPPLS